MRVRYTLRARADLESIFSYLSSRNPAAARAVIHEIERASGALALSPCLGPSQRPVAGVQSTARRTLPVSTLLPHSRQRSVDRSHPPYFTSAVDWRGGLTNDCKTQAADNR